MSVRLFVGNLSYDVNESDLREFFSPVGPLSNVIIPMDRDSGKPRGFAFIEFSDQQQANEAIARLNNQPLKGRNITINEARARDSRSGPASGPRPVSGSRPPDGAFRRPASGSPSLTPMGMDDSLMEDSRSGRGERRSRNFKSDSKPAKRKKQNYGSKGESGARKGPIRERSGGQFFGNVEDDDFDDDADFKYRW
jgi:cold-inducible RNA-binding protein